VIQGLQIDSAQERRRIVSFIRETVNQAGCPHLVVGLSGGIDSALVAYLGVEAVGSANVYGILLPYATSNPSSEADGRAVIEALGIPWERFEITPMVQPLLERYPDMDARRKGNIMARCRMIALFDQSARVNGLVAGTSNRTETLLGYFTMHGDGAAALKPIAHLYKCQVRALARQVGVPDGIIYKAPSADLWDGQTDEGELGFTYDEADQVLYLHTDLGLGPAEIAARGFERRTVEAICRRVQTTAFKRCSPPCLASAGRQPA
jgi:NAD+ synthase